ncbi:uncharacterized protein LOC142337108 [Convolutriloba macropyga]|uniref:uncharacterized protein LOC142337108 n=1 Tax=Convolutriloba macropyga TaxID=536237 RepID=UPI003F51C67C
MNYFVGNISVLITLVLSTTNHKTGKYIQPQPVPQKCQARFLGHVSPEREFFVRVLIETRERRSLGLSSIWAKTRTRGRNSTRSFVECGGAIVDKQWILTSAGCLKGINGRISIELGGFTARNRNKTKVITTRGYLQQNRYNLKNSGFALIKLSIRLQDDLSIELCDEVTISTIMKKSLLASCGMGHRLIDLYSDEKLSEFLVETYYWSNNACLTYDQVCYPIMDPSTSCGSVPGAPLYLIDYDDEMDVKCLYGIAQGERKSRFVGYNETSEKAFWSVPRSKGWIQNSMRNN